MTDNYFNYFTEIEERYQQCRGTRTLLSPLDWALIESWKDAGLPLEAVLVGIARAFEKFKARQRKYRMVNALATEATIAAVEVRDMILVNTRATESTTVAGEVRATRRTSMRETALVTELTDVSKTEKARPLER